MIPERLSTGAALAVWEAVKDAAPGERHLCGVIEAGPKGAHPGHGADRYSRAGRSPFRELQRRG